MSDANIQAIRWNDEALELLDQRLLPQSETWLRLTTAADTAKAIHDMVVRGAPAIGVTAAYGVVLAAREACGRSDWRGALEQDMRTLGEARPTAVNLRWALQRMARCIAELSANDPETLLELARAIHVEDVAQNRHMGELGAALFDRPVNILTHCNTGALATGGHGTALGVVRSAHERGLVKHVYADETRPWLQGARLTAWELCREGISSQLIADSAAPFLMSRGAVDWVIVGADRIAANGDVANKIGTHGLAVAARYHGVRFMVVAPTGTVDMDTPSGDAIPIEERASEELIKGLGDGVAFDAYNPVFDITPAKLVDVLITEQGAAHHPNASSMQEIMKAAD